MSDETDKASWLVSFLEGFGVPSNWAKVIAGAIIGAVSAYIALTSSGCSLTYTTTDADGSSTSLSTTIEQPSVKVSDLK
ncbi:MAG: hypothetical protein LUE08_00375 [Akkermansiaceae bacterium]|nr:hypothetical protein [Akkermansiaceae bacterium]